MTSEIELLREATEISGIDLLKEVSEVSGIEQLRKELEVSCIELLNKSLEVSKDGKVFKEHSSVDKAACEETIASFVGEGIDGRLLQTFLQ